MTGADAFHYRDDGPDGLDAVKDLWVRLRAHHAALPDWPFAGDVARRTFAERKSELLEKAAGGGLWVDLVTAATRADPIGYCVVSVTAARAGEIDSMFVAPEFRLHGVGTRLVRRALSWLDGQVATDKVVAVAYGNLSALRFYERFGFSARTIHMKHRA